MNFAKKITIIGIIACHLATTGLSAAQGVAGLPAPGAMVQASAAYRPVVLKGLIVKPDHPLEFDFILDPGDSDLTPEAFNAEAEKLIKYFLSALTVPEEDLWVNLSPYEKDRIIPEQFGQTEMGLDLLSQDYLLKQLTATFLSPDSAVGRPFWDKIYTSVAEEFGSRDAVVNTFNKVWIMPDIAQVFQNKDRAFILESRLKVLLEEDYIALQKTTGPKSTSLALQPSLAEQQGLKNNAALLRETVLPAIENEINHGKTFAPLRQIYHAIILATWFKENLKKSVLHKVYVDENKIVGVNSSNAEAKDEIYNQYLAAFKNGVCHLIREEYDPKLHAVIPRKYFSGGARLQVDVSASDHLAESVLNNNLVVLSSAIAPATAASTRPSADLPDEIAALQALLSDPAYLVKDAEPQAAAEILDALPHSYRADDARAMMDFLVDQFPRQLNREHQDTFSQRIFLRALENMVDQQGMDERQLLRIFEALGDSEYDYQQSALLSRFVAFQSLSQQRRPQRFSSAGWLKLLKRVLSIGQEGGQYSQLSFLILGAAKNFDKELFLSFLSLLDDFFYRQVPADSSQEVKFDTFKNALFDILMQERGRWRGDAAVAQGISRLIDDNVAIDRSVTFAGGRSAHSLTGLQAANLVGRLSPSI